LEILKKMPFNIFSKQKFKVGDLVKKEFYGDDQPSHGIVIDVSMNCLVGGHCVKVRWIDRQWNTEFTGSSIPATPAEDLEVVSAV
jgi:hypothetical protein